MSFVNLPVFVTSMFQVGSVCSDIQCYTFLLSNFHSSLYLDFLLWYLSKNNHSHIAHEFCFSTWSNKFLLQQGRRGKSTGIALERALVVFHSITLDVTDWKSMSNEICQIPNCWPHFGASCKKFEEAIPPPPPPNRQATPPKMAPMGKAC